MDKRFRSLVCWNDKSKTIYPIKVNKIKIQKTIKKKQTKTIQHDLKKKILPIQAKQPDSLEPEETTDKEEEKEKEELDQLYKNSFHLKNEETKIKKIIENESYDDENDDDDDEDDDEDFENKDNTIKCNSGATKIKLVADCPILHEEKGNVDIYIPNEYCVPTHLVEEISEMINLNPELGKKLTLKPKENLPIKAHQILKTIWSYWTLDKIEYMSKILIRRFKVTLSNIDWLCTNYSQIFPIKYTINTPEGIKHFDLHQNHKTNLNLWTRSYFGVFCRHERILIAFKSKELEQFLVPESNDGKVYWIKKFILGTRMINNQVWFYLITSICQLKFFEWAINRKVIDYCEEHVEEIDNHMKLKKKKPKDSGKRRKLCETVPFQPHIQDTKIKFSCDENNRFYSEIVDHDDT